MTFIMLFSQCAGKVTAVTDWIRACISPKDGLKLDCARRRNKSLFSPTNWTDLMFDRGRICRNHLSWLVCHSCNITASLLVQSFKRSSHDNRNFIVFKSELPSWTTLSEFKGIDPSPAWYCCYLVISPDTYTELPFLSLCGGVRGWFSLSLYSVFW